MRSEIIAALLVVAILAGVGGGYIAGSQVTATVRTTTIVTTTTTTSTALTTNTFLATSSLTVTYTTTQTTTITNIVKPPLVSLVILGASISHSLPQRALIVSYSKSLNASSYVAVENNGTTIMTSTQLLLIMKYGNGVYTGDVNSPTYSLEPGGTLYLEMSSLPVSAYPGEVFTVSVTIGQESTQPFTNTFY